MLGKISDRQWEVLERLAEAEWAAETVRQCWIPVSGAVDSHAVRALERAGLASTVPAELLLLRRYAHLVPDLTGAPAPAETLWEALTEAHFDRDANRWRLQLDDTGLAGLAHAVHLEALVGAPTATACAAPTTSTTPTPSPAASAAGASAGAVSLE
ncbi:DUF6417 family protein [Streptomyces xinghaiensis]|uniref:DUF6417 family protein n=1 Tax=Streptomyces xinghaiensis TaxID=1038928 RepID=UPI002E0DCDC0|nr:DUF6417 family protein [Streptomyces xinghaiensis]